MNVIRKLGNLVQHNVRLKQVIISVTIVRNNSNQLKSNTMKNVNGKLTWAVILFLTINTVGFGQTNEKPETIVENNITYKKINAVEDLFLLGFKPEEITRIIDEGGVLPDPNKPTHVKMTVSSKGRRAKKNYTCGWWKGGCWCSIEVQGTAIVSVGFPEQIDTDDNSTIPAKEGLAIYYSSENNSVIFR